MLQRVRSSNAHDGGAGDPASTSRAEIGAGPVVLRFPRAPRLVRRGGT